MLRRRGGGGRRRDERRGETSRYSPGCAASTNGKAARKLSRNGIAERSDPVDLGRAIIVIIAITKRGIIGGLSASQRKKRRATFFSLSHFEEARVVREDKRAAPSPSPASRKS